MAGLGALKYYVTIRTYTFANDDLGTARRTLAKQFAVFASATEKVQSEKVYGSAVSNGNYVEFETIKTTDVIKIGDEVIHNGTTYRIDSVKFVPDNRIQFNGKADGIG